MEKGWGNLSGGEHCRILVSESTMTYLRGQFTAHSIGSVRLKGKDVEIGVFRITDRIALDASDHLTKE